MGIYLPPGVYGSYDATPIFIPPPPPPPAPTLTSITPGTGSAAGGTISALQGTFLTGVTEVWYGAVRGTIQNIPNAQNMTVQSPAGTAGQVNVYVIGPGGTSNLVQFNYV